MIILKLNKGLSFKFYPRKIGLINSISLKVRLNSEAYIGKFLLLNYVSYENRNKLSTISFGFNSFI